MGKTETVIVRMDQELKDRLEAYASVEGVGLSEAVRRLVAQIPVIGKIPSSGLEMYDRIDKMFADHARVVTADGDCVLVEPVTGCVGLDGDIEIVGHDNGRE